MEKNGLIKNNGKLISTITSKYMRMSVKDRLNLLAGLFASCGTYDAESPYIVLNIKSQPVAKKVRSIVWSLGGICDMRYSYINGRYNLKMNFKDEKMKIYIMKDDIESGEVEYLEKNPIIGLRITEIEYQKEERCQCIEVDSIDHLYLIDDYIVTHNSA